MSTAQCRLHSKYPAAVNMFGASQRGGRHTKCCFCREAIAAADKRKRDAEAPARLKKKQKVAAVKKQLV